MKQFFSNIKNRTTKLFNRTSLISSDNKRKFSTREFLNSRSNQALNALPTVPGLINSENIKKIGKILESKGFGSEASKIASHELPANKNQNNSHILK